MALTEAQRKYHREYYEKHKERRKVSKRVAAKKYKQKFKDLKLNLSCSKCGESHPATLHFHHLDPSRKEMNVSDMLRGRASLEKTKEEISKCVVLCANCHAKLHWEESHIGA